MPCISRFIVDRLITDPPIIQHATQLLNTTPTMFVNRTIEHTLPHLIGNRNNPILDHLSHFMGWELPKICVHRNHDILAHLFMHVQDDVEEAMLFFLSIADTTLTGLLKTCSTGLIVKLAVELGHEDEETRRKVRF